MCGRPDQDLARHRNLLQPRGEVYGLSGDERGLSVIDDQLARLDPDPGLEIELVHCLSHRDGRSGGAQRVVLVRLWDAERGEDRVARELLDDPPVDRDAVGDALEELRDATPDDLGIGRSHHPRRVDEVHEQHRRELPLHH